MSESLPGPAQLTPLKRAFLAIEQLEAKLAAAERGRLEPIAIIGLGCRFPGGADSPDAFWRMLSRGEDGISAVPGDRWDVEAYYDRDLDAPGKTCARRAGFVPTIFDFDPEFFGISPREALGMDPQQRMLLEVSWEALEHAGVAPSSLEGSSTGVFVGICGFDQVTLQMKWNDAARIGPYYASGIAHSIASGRVSYTLGLQGPSISIDTACSSSLVAVHLAYQSLRAGDCRMALAGGTHAVLTPEISVALAKARMLAADGRCKAFDAAADGFVEGEGCGIVVMKRLSDALADGDRVLAVIRGSAVNQDGASSGLTVPNGPSQQNVIREALARAGAAPADVAYVEAHGTGTPLGDPIEVQALAAAFGPGRPPDRPLVIGSVKTNVGHLQSAAGVAGLIKTVLALQHGQIPPHLHLTELNPHVPWSEMPVVVSTQLSPWPEGYARRIAGVTSLGFSGTNAHVIVEEAPAQPQSTAASTVERPLHLLALSARSASALREVADRYLRQLDADPALSLTSVCYTANTGRSHFGHRVAVVGSSREDFRRGLRAFESGQETPAVVRNDGLGVDRPKVAFLFSGQGTQRAGMARQLYDTQPTFRSAIDRCAALLEGKLDSSLTDVLYGSASARLDETAYTQPALFAIEYALSELWMSWGVRPNALLGHSVGEIAAACMAGVFSLEDALTLVAARGRLMQSLPPTGGMAAVAASEDVVRSLLAPYGSRLAVAGENASDQIVISGERRALDEVVAVLDARGIIVTPLAVSHAFHSPLLDPILDEFEAVASRITYRRPQLPIVSNVTGALADPNEIATAAYWRRHAREPVRFSRGVSALAASGIQVFVELGPSPTLIGLARRSVKNPAALWLPSLRQDGNDWMHVLAALASLYTAGVPIDFAGFDRDYQRRKVALPTYPFERQRYWIDAPPQLAEHAGGRPARSASSGHLPFGGSRIRSALKEQIFEYRIDVRTMPFLADHRKSGRVVFPAAAFIEMIGAATEDVLQVTECSIDNFTIGAPLVLSSDHVAVVQLILTPGEDGTASFQIFSSVDGDAPAAWMSHASGNVRAAAWKGGASPFDVRSIEARCVETVAPDAFYDRLAGEGHEYGPAFRTIVAQSRCDGEALARVRLPADAVSGGAYRFHPTLLDGCLQAIRAALPSSLDAVLQRDVFLPVSFDRLTLRRTEGGDVHAHVRITESDLSNGALCADVDIFDGHGAQVGAVTNMLLRRVSREAISPRGGLDESLFTLRWQNDEAAREAPATLASDDVWIVLADESGVGSQLAGRLEEIGARVTTVPRGAVADSSDAGGSLAVRLSDLMATYAGTGKVAGVVFLRALDTLVAPDAEQLSGDVAAVCGDLLDLLRALADTPSAEAARLWVVTEGAQPAERGEPVNAAQGAVWGLARTITAEQPHLRCVRLDLDPSDRASHADRILGELVSPSDEDNVAHRGSDRRVLRLIPAAAPQDRRGVGMRRSEPIALEIAERGVLENLRVAAASRRQPGPGEIEVEVHASGLNFRDVLDALGTYAGQSGALGSECAGCIAAVGEGVDHFTVGQRVVVLAPDAFRSFITVSAARAIAIPAGVSTIEAAGVGIAFTTAHVALSHLAGLRRGERVLIHAAAGGVGLAAVQLAQRAGAEVFATAGNAEKHRFLHAAGVEHVMSSRSVDFAAQILTATHGEGVDVVLNSLPGDMIPRSLDVLRAGGRFVEIGKAGIWTSEQVAAVRPDVQYFPTYLGGAEDQVVQSLLQEIAAGLTDGSLHPLPTRAFAVHDAADAFRFMARAKHIGKVVLTMPAAMAPGSARLREDATYLITGGLGSLGLEVAAWMVGAGACELVLVGRQAPSASAAAAIAALEQRGARVRVVSADVCSASEVSRLFGVVDDDGPPLAGLVHAAGVVDDGVLGDLTTAQVARVLGPKVAGAWNLHIHTRARALDFFVLFSSIAATVPSAGQGNYAAGNAFLDGLAHLRRAQGLPAISIEWGPWAVGMAAAVDERSRQRWTDRGIRLIDAAVGPRTLGGLLEWNEVQPIVFPVDWPKFLTGSGSGWVTPLFERVTRAAPASPGAAPPRLSLRARLEAEFPGRRRGAVASAVLGHARRVLGLDERRSIDPRRPLRELGLDSLMAVELRNTLGREVDAVLPATVLFKYPTIDALTDFLCADVLQLESGAAAPRDAVADPIELLEDDEARRLLGEELDSLGAEPWLKPSV